MRRIAFTFFLTVCCVISKAQNENANWFFAGYPSVYYNFKTDVWDTVPYINRDFFETNTSISDTNGNLLFYTNGCHLYNKLHWPLTGETGFNAGFLTSHFDNQGHGLSTRQSAIILKRPGSEKEYYVFHLTSNDSILNEFNDRLYYTTVDMNLAQGYGAVTSLNNILISKDSMGGFNMNAVKHANGKDWWIIAPCYFTNKYFTFLLTEQGIVQRDTQWIGELTGRWRGAGVFSADGSKFANGNIMYEGVIDSPKINVFDFDRCTGKLSNPLIITPYALDGINQGAGTLSFSPSGRFLYTSPRLNQIMQYDLLSLNPQNSVVNVGLLPEFGFRKFYSQQFMPDEKIMIDGFNSPSGKSIIQFPDEEGISCFVDTFAFNVPLYTTQSMPFFPHYNTLPASLFQAKPGPEKTRCLGDSVQIGGVLIDGLVYTWSPAYNITDVHSPNPKVYPDSTTTYYMHVHDTITRGISCRDTTYTVTVVVPDNPPCYTSVAQLNNSTFQIYPNPATTEVTITYGDLNLKKDAGVSISVSNYIGQAMLIQNVLVGTNTLQLNVSDFKPGVYVVYIRAAGEVLATAKFAKQ